MLERAGFGAVVDKDFVDAALLSNVTAAPIDLRPSSGQPCVASIYQLDSIVRRAPALQATADARDAAPVAVAAAVQEVAA